MIRVSVAGMSCENCVRHVQETLARLEGVAEVEVSLSGNMATLKASDNLSDEVIRDSLEAEGYEVTNVVRA